MEEILISGIGVSQDVIAAIVSEAAEKVEGVAHVGGNDIASSLVSVFTKKQVAPARAVEAEVIEDGLAVTVHLAVFFGYTFTSLAVAVRDAVAQAIKVNVGVDVAAVNVCIDSLVFPKE